LLAGKFEVKKRKIFYKNFPTSWYEKKLWKLSNCYREHCGCTKIFTYCVRKTFFLVETNILHCIHRKRMRDFFSKNSFSYFRKKIINFKKRNPDWEREENWEKVKAI
jgi:hypothetical protein